MPCVICGAQSTVRSHLVPRALAFEIRQGDPNLTILERNGDRPQRLPAGRFDDDLLCDRHETVTGQLDKYGVEFIRNVRNGRGKARGNGFYVGNPHPAKLSRFAQSIIWRAVVSPEGNANPTALGSHYNAITASIFEEAPASVELYCASTKFENDEREHFTMIMPERRREHGRWSWQFQLNGCFFVLFVGSPEKAINFSAPPADQAQRVYIPYLKTVHGTEWKGMMGIMRSLKRPFS